MNQNHTTMMPKKYRFFLIFIINHHTMMPENFEKIMYLRRDRVKTKLLWFPKNGDISNF